jgi:hypothetical protein
VEKKLSNLHELYDRQAKWPMSDDVVNDENRGPLYGDDEHQESNDDDVQQQRLLHMPMRMDRTMMY